MKFLIFLVLLSGCTVMSRYHVERIEYCYQVGERIFCESGMRDYSYYPGCSVYEDDCK